MTRLTVPSNQARPGAPLAPVLGQQQIKVQDFIVRFHQESAPYHDGVPLSCRVRRQGLKFELTVQLPTTFVLLWGSTLDGRLTPADLYGVSRFQSRKVPVEVRAVFGCLRSTRLKLG